MLGINLQEVRNAWLSPEGEFHPVEYWGHSVYAQNVLGEPCGMLEAKGWATLSGYVWEAQRGWVTQAQLDAIFDWCSVHCEPMPAFEVI